MVCARLVLLYDWGSEHELDVLEIPLWRGYGKTAVEASTRLLECLAAAEVIIVLDWQRRSWLIYRETLQAMWVWSTLDAKGFGDH